MDFKLARYNMVQQQIRPWDVLDPEVLAVLNKLPRERFVPKPFKPLAYSDSSFPIGNDQVILPPKIIGRLLQALKLNKKDSVLEIGTGAGYLTAALAMLAKKVLTYDIFEEFSKQAKEHLDALELKNVSFKNTDAFQDLPLNETFDAIVITGSLPTLPKNLKQALSMKGRLFVVVGDAPSQSALLLIRKGKEHWVEKSLFETVINRLPNKTISESFEF